MEVIAAWDNWCGFFVKIYPDVSRFEGVYIETKRVKKIRQFAGSFKVQGFREPKFGPYLQQTFDHLDGSKALCRIAISCHSKTSCPCAPAGVTDTR